MLFRFRCSSFVKPEGGADPHTLNFDSPLGRLTLRVPQSLGLRPEVGEGYDLELVGPGFAETAKAAPAAPAAKAPAPATPANAPVGAGGPATPVKPN